MSVLSLCDGTGTAVVAALADGHDAAGIDKSPAMHDAAVTRLGEYMALEECRVKMISDNKDEQADGAARFCIILGLPGVKTSLCSRQEVDRKIIQITTQEQQDTEAASTAAGSSAAPTASSGPAARSVKTASGLRLKGNVPKDKDWKETFSDFKDIRKFGPRFVLGAVHWLSQLDVQRFESYSALTSEQQFTTLSAKKSEIFSYCPAAGGTLPDGTVVPPLDPPAEAEDAKAKKRSRETQETVHDGEDDVPSDDPAKHSRKR